MTKKTVSKSNQIVSSKPFIGENNVILDTEASRTYFENEMKIVEALREDSLKMMRVASARFTEAQRKIRYADLIVACCMLITVGLMLMLILVTKVQ